MLVNLVIMQPQDYVHSLGFLDSARFLRFQLGRLGARVSVSKNVARADAVNVVLGAHLGLPDGWGTRALGLIFNQEQLGDGGAALPAGYVELLRRSHVLDYDPANGSAYHPAADTQGPLLRAVVPLLDAPYLRQPGAALNLAARPIDLLFFGSVNDARRRVIERIERCGVSVHRFDGPVYGPERDAYVAQSKAVLNIPFYDTNRFERVRAFQALSLGTPVVSLRRRGLVVDPVFEDAVQWFTDEQTELYFTHLFATQPWIEDSEARLLRWQQHEALPAYADLMNQLRRIDWAIPVAGQPTRRAPWINLTPEMGLPMGWSVGEPADSACPPEEVQPAEAACALVRCDDTQRLIEALTQACRQVQNNGVVMIDWEMGLFNGEGPGVVAAREWTESRIRLALALHMQRGDGSGVFDLQDLKWIRRPAGPLSTPNQPQLEFARLMLLKREPTVREAMIRRTCRDDFGGLPQDLPFEDEATRTASSQAPEVTRRVAAPAAVHETAAVAVAVAVAVD